MKTIKTKFSKLAWVLLLLGCVLSTIFLKIQKKPRELVDDRVKLIDNVGDNFLFRGNNPFVKKGDETSFAYDELSHEFKKILKEKKYTINDFELIDISLLDLDEYNQITTERKFFRQNPDKGEFVNISTIAPELLFTGFKYDFLTDNYNDLTTLELKKIHYILSQKYDKPVIIYLHCNGGRDRTGFMSAAYNMLYQDVTLQEAVNKNQSDAGRSSEGLYADAIGSYCRYIQKNYNKENNFCDDEK